MEWLKLTEDGEIEIASEEVKLVPEMQALLTLKYNKGPKDNDGRKKYRLKSELKYLYLVYSVKSPYKDYSETERRVEALLDCKFPHDWKESDELVALIPKFLKGNQSKFVRLLATAEKSLDKLEGYLNSVDFTERKENGDLANKPKDVVDLLKTLPGLAQTLQELEQQVKLGTVGAVKSKGDNEVGWMAMSNPTTKKIKDEDDDETDDK